MSKKVLGIIIFVVIILVAVACVFLLGNQEENVEGTLESIMEKLYTGISEENLPMMLGNIELTSENIEGFIGTADVKYKEAIASESMVGSIAHSVVLLRLERASDANAAIQTIKDNVNPRKWICVEASNVIVKNKGDLVVLIMSNEQLTPTIEDNFNSL